jgi:hypothetical protein
MGVVHYLTGLPGCVGNCHQGDMPCESPELCGGDLVRRHTANCRADLDEIRAVRMAGAGMACAEATTSPADLSPLRTWPWGEHSRPGKLTEAELERAAEAKAISRRPLPALLLAKGAMTHEPPTWRERLRRAWIDFRIRRLGRL